MTGDDTATVLDTALSFHQAFEQISDHGKHHRKQGYKHKSQRPFK